MPGYEVLGDDEFQEIRQIFEKSRILFRHGFDGLRNGVYKVNEFEEQFAKRMKAKNALAVSSGTAALRVALAGLNIGPGDEVITQAFTFVATVEAIVETGAQPIITEIDESLNMDPSDLEKKITNKTKAIIAVHMLGVPCDMKAIISIAKKYGLYVIEDTAWGCGGQLDNQYLGTIGDIGTFSFDFAKTMTTGEGGMVVCQDSLIAEKCRAYHDHGHENNPNLSRWEDSRSGSGFNYRMTELQGAVGLAQLKKLSNVVAIQRENKHKLHNILSKTGNFAFRKQPVGSLETADAIVFITKNNENAISYRKAFLKNKINTKILPEAITWHFAGTWNHIPALISKYPDLENAFIDSLTLLEKAVALPVNVKMENDFLNSVEKSLLEVER